MAKLKLAVLGVGDVAQRDYLPELHRLAERVELVAVCGKGEARVRSVASEYGVPRWHTDHRRMLDDSRIDAVLNLTPIQIHAETNLAVLRAGKHLYSEKPFAGSVAEGKLLEFEALRRGLKVVSAPCVMLFPQVCYAAQLLVEGAIGSVYSARAHGHGGVPPWSGYSSDPSQFFTAGGGPLVDMGVYPLHALTGLLGPVRRVAAMAARGNSSFVVPDGPAIGKRVDVTVEDNWRLVLDLGDRRLASVDANNVVQATRAPQLEIFGLEGTIAVNLLDVSAPVELYRPSSGWEQIAMPRTGRASGPDHLLGVEHLVDCVEHDGEPVLSIAHALHVVDILERVALSAAEGRMMEVTSTFDRMTR